MLHIVVYKQFYIVNKTRFRGFVRDERKSQGAENILGGRGGGGGRLIIFVYCFPEIGFKIFSDIFKNNKLSWNTYKLSILNAIHYGYP